MIWYAVPQKRSLLLRKQSVLQIGIVRVLNPIRGVSGGVKLSAREHERVVVFSVSTETVSRFNHHETSFRNLVFTKLKQLNREVV